MDRTTLKQLQEQIEAINRLTGSPLDCYSKGPDGFRYNLGNYHLDQAYAGVALGRMVEGGGTRTIFERTTKRELRNLMSAFLMGMRTAMVQSKGE